MKVVVVGAPVCAAAPPRTPGVSPVTAGFNTAWPHAVFAWSFDGMAINADFEGQVWSTMAIWCSRASTGWGSRTLSRRWPAVPALGPVGPRAGRVGAIDRGSVSLLSRASAGPGHFARPHRYDPHRPRLGTVETSTPKPVYQGLAQALSTLALVVTVSSPADCCRRVASGLVDCCDW